MAYRLGVDIGGTFTDFALLDEAGGGVAIHKQLTTPEDPSGAVLAGTAALLEREGVAVEAVSAVVHGTTLITNAVIERRGARTGLLTTAGFRDVLDMREEKRYDVFDLRLRFPEPLVPPWRRAEVDERCRYDGSVERPLDLEGARAAIARLVAEEGIASLAVCLLHAYANPAHEQAVAALARAEFPGLYVSTSAEVFPELREYARFSTTCINAYTQPMFDAYLDRIEAGLAELGIGAALYIMTSAGGTVTAHTARHFPVRMLESGPAAGVLMSAFHGRSLAIGELLSFDMGGTTAKGALVHRGAPLDAYAMEVAREHEFKRGSGLPARIPVIDMIEIGAGGGSIAALDERGLVRVGPRSAGADPGPACYGRGGTAPTLTDANLVLGYLDPGFFLGGALALDRAAAERAVDSAIARPLDLERARAAWGIHDIINEDVARAFRMHASERGFDYRRCSMVAFGGSGPVHALAIARKLRIPRVIFPVGAGVMSALGLLASPLAFEAVQSRHAFLRDLDDAALAGAFAPLAERARAPLLAAGVAPAAIALEHRLDMRYHGQGYTIEVVVPAVEPGTRAALPGLFAARYAEIYALSLLDAPLEITTWKVRAHGPRPRLDPGYRVGAADAAAPAASAVKGERSAYFGATGEYVACPVLDRYALAPGDRVAGPALIEERESTCVVGPGDRVAVDRYRNLIADLGGSSA